MGEQTERLKTGLLAMGRNRTFLKEGMLLEIAFALSRCADALEGKQKETFCPQCGQRDSDHIVPCPTP